MITLSEHTIEESIIDKNGWVLDLGCINFTFANSIKKYCNNIICVDPNPNIKIIPEGIFYENKAITHLDNCLEQEFFIYNDINGYSLLNPPKDWCILENKIIVDLIDIKSIMKKYKIEIFELIKIDIEGSEYKLLENIDWSISKQYSVEFHDFRFMNPYFPNNEKFYSDIFEKMNIYCDIIQHEPTDHPGFPKGMGRNYWDSLFVNKKFIKK